MSLKRSIYIYFLFLFSATAWTQGIQDSIFQIESVEIFSTEDLFKTEEAGMKETMMDTMVMLNKANLSLDALLSENSPLFIKSHGRGAMATASFRGTAASHTQVNWNGMNINSPMLGSVDFSQIPVYLIDDINLKYGTSSLADQSGGLGGSVNISNSVNWDSPFSAKYLQSIGSFSTYDEFLSIGFGNKKIQSKTRLYHNYSKNNYTFTNKSIPLIDYKTEEITYPLDTNHNADYRMYGGLQELYFRAGDRNIFSLKYWGQYSERTLPQVSSYEGPDNSNKNRQYTDDHKVVGDWKHYGHFGKLTLLSGFGYKEMLYEQKYLVGGQGLSTTVYSESEQRSFYNSAKYAYDISPTFSFNASLNANFHDVSSEDTVNHTGYDNQRSETSLFLSTQKQFLERFNVNFMVRQDLVDGKLSPTTPFLGWDYKILKEQELVLKGNIAKNHHLPSLNDLYWQPGGNPDLKPEDGFSSEIGLEYETQWDDLYLYSEITTYYSDINNWIVWIPNTKGYWEPENVKTVISKGLEINLKLNGKINNLRYSIFTNYAYTSAQNYGDIKKWGDESYGKQLVYVPKHSGNAMLNLDYNNFFFTFQHNSYSERFTTSNNDISERKRLHPYFMNNIMMGYHWKLSQLKISTELKIYNLFDENYRSSLYHPMPGRNYMFLVTFNL